MCLGVPGRITEVWKEDGALMANADFVGELRKVCLNYLPELGVGDFVIVHAGFALTALSEDEAEKTIRLMRDVGLLEEAAATVGEGGRT